METRISYIKKNYARTGIISTFLFIIALIFISIGIGMALKSNGNSSLTAAAFGFCGVIISIVGIMYGLLAHLEEDKNYIFAKIGVVTNTLLLIGMFVLIIFGGR